MSQAGLRPMVLLLQFPGCLGFQAYTTMATCGKYSVDRETRRRQINVFQLEHGRRTLIPSSSHSDAVFEVLIGHVNPVLVT